MHTVTLRQLRCRTGSPNLSRPSCVSPNGSSSPINTARTPSHWAPQRAFSQFPAPETDAHVLLGLTQDQERGSHLMEKLPRTHLTQLLLLGDQIHNFIKSVIVVFVVSVVSMGVQAHCLGQCLLVMESLPPPSLAMEVFNVFSTYMASISPSEYPEERFSIYELLMQSLSSGGKAKDFMTVWQYAKQTLIDVVALAVSPLQICPEHRIRWYSK